MRVTVCELRNSPETLAEDWVGLVDHLAAERSDLVLLPEFPFYRWLPAKKEVDPVAWEESIRVHRSWVSRLPELNVQTVLMTLPVIVEDRRFNEGVLWSREYEDVTPVHRKRYLPEEAGFWEASWYSRGDEEFTPIAVQTASIGFMICSEIWFTRHARDYGKAGVHLLASPRATMMPTVEKWVMGGRASAVVSGAYSLSSNFSGSAGSQGTWGGTGWIIEPEEGRVLGTTSAEHPFLTLEIDLSIAERAKSTYPRDVIE